MNNQREQTGKTQELSDTKRRLDLALTESGAGVWEWNLDTDDLYWSDELLDLLGLSEDDFDGSIEEFERRLHPDDTERVEQQIEHALETGDQYRSEQRIRTESGEYCWLDVRGQLSDDGRSLIGVAFNITEHKQRERELARQNDRLDKFTSVTSHDLRNPLQAAKRNLELAQRAHESEHLGGIERSLNRMDVLIDDLLTLARSGQTVEDTDVVDLKSIAKNAWTTVNINACDLNVTIPTETHIQADRKRLLEVFENLYTNAAVHNDAPVAIRVGIVSEQQCSTDETKHGGFFVADNGQGIPAARQDRVFDHGYTTSSDGTGLGLSIVRDIVEAHGWAIDVTDGPDGGARFEITGIAADPESG